MLPWINVQSQVEAYFPNLIAHACGNIDNNTYTNSKEAFLSSIEKGFKFIEIDLSLTSDSQLVITHSWSDFNSMSGHPELNDTVSSIEYFKTQKILGKYTPMTIKDVTDFMEIYPNVIIVTDKISNFQTIDTYFSKYKDRVIIESFTFDDFNQLRENGYYTMFSGLSDEILISTIENMILGNTPIDFIVTNISDDFQEIARLRCLLNLKVAMYTSDDVDFINEHLGNDVELIYTDLTEP